MMVKVDKRKKKREKRKLNSKNNDKDLCISNDLSVTDRHSLYKRSYCICESSFKDFNT